MLEAGSEQLVLDELRPSPSVFVNGETCSIRSPFRITADIVFDIAFSIEAYTLESNHLVYTDNSTSDGKRIRWLPRGDYALDWIMPRMSLSPGMYVIKATPSGHVNGKHRRFEEQSVEIEIQGQAGVGHMSGALWHYSSEGAISIQDLPWQQGHDSWFFRHFDHAAEIIIDYMLGSSPLLSGKILDVGCGDGITDLGVYLRSMPELLVGIDPDRAYERLPDILRQNYIDIELPENLVHTPDDANSIPYPDDFFDVVISWGSVEHMVGGYKQALREMRRVLRRDGLLFIHPGLYYGNFGHHLGEFSDEPFFHLTKSHDEIRELVFSKDPDLMDRSGYEHVSQEDFWRYYNELNPITVAEFERELRELNFEFYRAALRTEGRIEYSHPNLQDYPVQDLATLEFYLSAYNRK